MADDPAEQEPDLDEAAPPVADRIIPRRDAMALRLVAVAVTLALAIAIAFVVVVFAGPPSVDDLRRQAGLDGKRELLIGVKSDQPGVAEFGADKVWRGFDIQIAYMIAEDLGFRRNEIRFLTIESEDRERMQATDSDGNTVGVDMVIASYSITKDREDTPGVTFSWPYLSTEQSVLTLANHKAVSALVDLVDQRVCTLAASTSTSAPARAGIKKLYQRKRMGECIAGLDSGEFDAVTTDAAILAGFKYRAPKKYTHWDIGDSTPEFWGVNVGDNEALLKMVNLTLYRSRESPSDNRWEDAFDQNFRPEISADPKTPIASDQQPKAVEPDVRQWPWERV